MRHDQPNVEFLVSVRSQRPSEGPQPVRPQRTPEAKEQDQEEEEQGGCRGRSEGATSHIDADDGLDERKRGLVCRHGVIGSAHSKLCTRGTTSAAVLDAGSHRPADLGLAGETVSCVAVKRDRDVAKRRRRRPPTPLPVTTCGRRRGTRASHAPIYGKSAIESKCWNTNEICNFSTLKTSIGKCMK